MAKKPSASSESSVYRITEQGSPTRSGNPYDIAIDGKGYFQITMPSGEIAYTRAGNFALDRDGNLGADRARRWNRDHGVHIGTHERGAAAGHRGGVGPRGSRHRRCLDRGCRVVRHPASPGCRHRRP